MYEPGPWTPTSPVYNAHRSGHRGGPWGGEGPGHRGETTGGDHVLIVIICDNDDTALIKHDKPVFLLRLLLCYTTCHSTAVKMVLSKMVAVGSGRQ